MRDSLKLIYVAADYGSGLTQTVKFMNFDMMINENYQSHLSPVEFRFVDFEIGLFKIRRTTDIPKDVEPNTDICHSTIIDLVYAKNCHSEKPRI